MSAAWDRLPAKYGELCDTVEAMGTDELEVVVMIVLHQRPEGLALRPFSTEEDDDKALSTTYACAATLSTLLAESARVGGRHSKPAELRRLLLSFMAASIERIHDHEKFPGEHA